MVFQLVDTEFINFPEGQTEDRIRSVQTPMGIGAIEFVRRVDAAMRDINRPDPLISDLTFTTTQREISTGGSTDRVWQRSSEFVMGRSQVGAEARGFARPLYFYEIDLGFTRRTLMTMGLAQFNEELRGTGRAIRRGKRADVLRRLFDNNPWPLDDKGRGSSPAFAGSGVDDDAFVGTLPNGQLTPNNYTHYAQAADTEAGIHAALMGAIEDLDNWYGANAEYDLIGSVAAINQIRTYLSDAKFVAKEFSLIRPGTATTTALVDGTKYLGVYAGRIRVRAGDPQIVGKALAVFRTAGANSPANPLAIVYDELFGQNAVVDDRDMFPLVQASIQQTYGIGIGDDRVGASLISIGGTPGTYAPPEISRGGGRI